MNKKDKKDVSKKLVVKNTTMEKKLSKEQVQKKLNTMNFYEEHPDMIYKKIWQLFSKKTGDWDQKEHEYYQNYIKGINNFTRSHIVLAETQVNDNLRTIIIELTNNLIEEYECNTTLEKALCETIADNYGKTMQLSWKLTQELNGKYISDTRTKYMAMLSKEKERANRNYLYGLQTLIDLKQPKTNIHIKTKNAYMAQNQQINTNQSNDDENISD